LTRRLPVQLAAQLLAVLEGGPALVRAEAVRVLDAITPQDPATPVLAVLVLAGWKPPSRSLPPVAAPRTYRSCWAWPTGKARGSSATSRQFDTGVAVACRPGQEGRAVAIHGASPGRFGAMTLQGRVLAGRYALGAMLGAGGMAHVYGARDRVLQRTVAVKVLSPPYDQDPDLGRGSVGRPAPPPRSATPTS
jgi:hypothetical protein